MGRLKKGIKDKELAKLIKNLAKNLYETRRMKGLTLQSLASQAGMATSTIWEIENGKAEDLRFSTLTSLAQVLEIDPIKLFE